ncbi:MAG: HAD family phosphatase [Bacteroidota bacterium]
MTNPVAVIFDMDGVIIDSNPPHKIALRQFCEKYGYKLSDEELVNKIYGRTNKEWIATLFGKPLTAAELTAYGEEKEKIFRDIYKKDMTALPGLEDFLKKLDQYKIPKAIGTSAPRSNVDFVLDELHLKKYFDIILDESNVQHGKPNPEIYLKVAARLQFSPDRCIVFEDSLSGVASAKAAGSKVVGVTTTHTREELAHTDFVIDDFVGLDPLQLIKEVYK